MPWATSSRRARLPNDWRARKATVLRRDGYRCRWVTDGQRCEARATEVDHITPGDDHSLTNLQGLCSDHHTAKTVAEAHDAMRARRMAARHPVERHPGLT